MANDDVIDLSRYRRRQADRKDAGLSLLGAEGVYRHFALPLWRMASVAGATWAGLVRRLEEGPAETLVAVDLRPGGARREPEGGLTEAPLQPPPHIVEDPDGRRTLAVSVDGRGQWYVVLGEGTPSSLGARAREDLLFLAGECAGLLAVLEAGSEGP